MSRPIMDDFFNFEDATQVAHAGTRRPFRSQDVHTSSYDIDLILAQAIDDDNSFSSLQHFVDPMLDAPGVNHHHMGAETHMWETNEVHDFSNWISTAERPPVPCIHCRQNGQECFVIRNPATNRSGSCTSCVTLSRHCNLSNDSSNEHVHVMNHLQSTQSWPNNFPGHPGHPLANANGRRNSEYEAGSGSQDSNTPPHAASNESGDGTSKSGARFSRETVRILRNWLSLHHRHPYPTEEEKEDLKRRTGLNKVQITNWLANARRRGQVKAPRAKSPATHGISVPMKIPKHSQPITFESMDPMERWRNSPPEHEPASVTAIAKAVTTSNLPSAENSPGSYPHTDEGSLRSHVRASSISSRNTTPSSGGSFASAFSHQSRASFGSFGKRGRRRRRQIAKPMDNGSSMVVRQYQCTFCVESFKTKHDWQRHEKSLHLSLERWVCAPHGNTMFDKTKKAIVCVFCGSENPDDTHMETHNYTGCLERSLEERTFYRKDHLRQHLRLVHDSNLHSSMDAWKVATPNVRSRCGFCNISMDSWAARVDHLAEHFKAGKTMADWEGDWGFEPKVKKLVENYTLPHLIHQARNPTTPEEPSAGDFMGPYDAIKGGLLAFAQKQASLGLDVSDDEFRAEACRIVYGYQAEYPAEVVVSWFRDMIMCPSDELWLGDLRQKAGLPGRKDRIVPQLDIDDKPGVEKFCELERQLTEYVTRQRALGLTPTDAELQAEGCRIVVEYDTHFSSIKDSTAATWFCKLIMSSTDWLQRFRQRVGLPTSSEMANLEMRPKDQSTIDSTIHNYQRLENDLSEYVRTQASSGQIPSDADLQLKARLIIYGVDDSWNQTPADNSDWLRNFKQGHGILTNTDALHPSSHGGAPQSRRPSPGAHMQASMPYANASPTSSHSQPVSGSDQPSQATRTDSAYSMKNARCYRRHERLLANYVALCMSPEAQNPHIPTDEEIRAKAREIIQQDASPWNLTAIDNDEWLLRFKQSCGLAPLEDGSMWPYAQLGGTAMMPHSEASNVDNGPNQYHYMASTPQTNPTSPSSSHGGVGAVFSSLEMETALAKYFQDSLAHGFQPTDDDLRTRARMISRMANSEADDPNLLEAFKRTYLRETSAKSMDMDFAILPPVSLAATTAGFSSTVSAPFANPNPMESSMPWIPVLEAADPEARIANTLPSISRDEFEKRLQGGPLPTQPEGAW